MEMQSEVLPPGNLSYWNRVTPFSRYCAMLLFITLPFVGFWLGTQYQSSTVVIDETKPIEKAKFVSKNDSDTEQDASWTKYRNEEYGFGISLHNKAEVPSWDGNPNKELLRNSVIASIMFEEQLRAAYPIPYYVHKPFDSMATGTSIDELTQNLKEVYTCERQQQVNRSFGGSNSNDCSVTYAFNPRSINGLEAVEVSGGYEPMDGSPWIDLYIITSKGVLQTGGVDYYLTRHFFASFHSLI